MPNALPLYIPSYILDLLAPLATLYHIVLFLILPSSLYITYHPSTFTLEESNYTSAQKAQISQIYSAASQAARLTAFVKVIWKP
jgi:hypothetical protein